MLMSAAAASLSLIPFYSASSQGLDVYTSINAIAYAENNSAYHLIKGTETTYNRSESAFTFNEFAIGTRYKNISFSLISRYEWFLGFTKDTMELYGTTVNGTLIEPDKRYDLDLKTNHIKTDGFRIAYHYDGFEGINLYGAASYLKARELMVGETSGWASLTGDCGDGFECYSGNLDLSYTYTEDKLFDRQTNAPESLYGYSFDLGVDWQLTDSVFTSLYVQDVYSEVLWDQSPFTDAQATTATSVIEDGKIKIEPVITGYEGNRDFKQRLPVKYNALLGYSRQAHTGYIQGFQSYDTLLVNLGYQYRAGQSQYLFKYYPLEQAFGIAYKSSIFDLALTSDSFDYQKTSILEIRLGFSIPLYR